MCYEGDHNKVKYPEYEGIEGNVSILLIFPLQILSQLRFNRISNLFIFPKNYVPDLEIFSLFNVQCTQSL